MDSETRRHHRHLLTSISPAHRLTVHHLPSHRSSNKIHFRHRLRHSSLRFHLSLEILVRLACTSLLLHPLHLRLKRMILLYGMSRVWIHRPFNKFQLFPIRHQQFIQHTPIHPSLVCPLNHLLPPLFRSNLMSLSMCRHPLRAIQSYHSPRRHYLPLLDELPITPPHLRRVPHVTTCHSLVKNVDRLMYLSIRSVLIHSYDLDPPSHLASPLPSTLPLPGSSSTFALI